MLSGGKGLQGQEEELPCSPRGLVIGQDPGSRSIFPLPRPLANPDSDQCLEIQEGFTSTSKVQGVVRKGRVLLSGKKDSKALSCPRRRTDQAHAADHPALRPITPLPVSQHREWSAGSPGSPALVGLTPSSQALSRGPSAPRGLHGPQSGTALGLSGAKVA